MTTIEYSVQKLLQEVVEKKRIVYVQHLSKGALIELQSILKSSSYYSGAIDGVYGIKTLNAIKEFKRDSYLARPNEIGPSTVAALENLVDKATISEQVIKKPIVINKETGKHSGRKIMLPGQTIVHEHQLIVPGIPLTWGEMTKGLTRIPENIQIVQNIRFIAHKFSRIRKRINQPLRINSGYRPPHLKIGARFSQHKKALALDISPLNSKDIYKLWNVCVESDAVGLGRGMRHGFCHVDYRRNSRRIVFNY